MSERPVTGKRQYRMAARAEAKAATRLRILDAAESCADELPAEEVTLTVVAKRAGVSVQTILRHFGSSENLFLTTVIHMGMKMGGDRDVEASWGTERIVAVLVDHYERFGDRVLWGLAQEHRHAQIKQLTDLGRVLHAKWCEDAFAPALKGLRGTRRKRLVAQLVAATDIYVWKVLRRDRELSPAQVKLAIVELLAPLTEPSS
ncbi:MAG TPA: helix-turn-helix domain-containing protein [Solirubrobacterales bacterium]